MNLPGVMLASLAQKAGRDHLRRVVERITGEPLRDDDDGGEP